MSQQIFHLVALVIFAVYALKLLRVIINAANRHFKSDEPVVANTFEDCEKPYEVLGQMKDGPVTPSDSAKDAVFCLLMTIVTLIGLAIFLPLVLAVIGHCIHLLAGC